MDKGAMIESQPWSEYRRLVVQSLKTLDTDLNNLREDIQQIELRFTKEIVALKVKVAFYGVLAGTVSGSVITLLIQKIILGR